MARITRIGPLSLAQIFGILYAFIGLIFGFFISLFAMAGGFGMGKGLFGILFGTAAIIALPIFYGILGFIMGLLTGWLFNVAASWCGGLDIDIKTK
jgi:hypothetical protein